MLYRLFELYLLVGRVFGRWVAPLAFCALTIVRIVLVDIMQRVDMVSSRVRRCRVNRPIVLVGNPRSGTTFLHRYLDANGVGTGSRIWDCYIPSVVMQRLLSPLVPFLSRAFNNENNAHAAGLMLVDTDDFAIMARFWDGALLQLWLLAFRGSLNSLPSHGKINQRDFEWLRRVWQRTLVNRNGTRIVAKLHSLGDRLPAFLAAVPDSKVVYMVRDPVEAIASSMSLATTVLEQQFGFWQLPEAVRQHYLSNFYLLHLNLYRRFVEDWTSGAIDRNRVMIVRYDRLMHDFAGTMDELLRFVKHEPDDRLRAAIASAAATQRDYRSRHSYKLERFGFNASKIRRDCRFVYDTLLPDLIKPSEAA